MHVHVRVPVCECVCVCGQATLYLNCSKVSQNWKLFCCLFCQGLPELSPSFHFTFLSFVSPRPFGEEHKWIRSGNLYYVFPVVSSALYTRRYSEVKHAGNILEWSCVCFAVLLFNDSPLRVIVCSVEFAFGMLNIHVLRFHKWRTLRGQLVLQIHVYLTVKLRNSAWIGFGLKCKASYIVHSKIKKSKWVWLLCHRGCNFRTTPSSYYFNSMLHLFTNNKFI